jgi:hypothetical protein
MLFRDGRPIGVIEAKPAGTPFSGVEPQAMRSDHPGGAPPIGARFKGVFRRVERGRYTLTDKRKQLLEELRR